MRDLELNPRSISLDSAVKVGRALLSFDFESIVVLYGSRLLPLDLVHVGNAHPQPIYHLACQVSDKAHLRGKFSHNYQSPPTFRALPPLSRKKEYN